MGRCDREGHTEKSGCQFSVSAVSSVSRTSACCRSGRYALLTGPGEADAAGLRSRPLKSKALEKVKQLQKRVELSEMQLDFPESRRGRRGSWHTGGVNYY